MVIGFLMLATAGANAQTTSPADLAIEEQSRALAKRYADAPRDVAKFRRRADIIVDMGAEPWTWSMTGLATGSIVVNAAFSATPRKNGCELDTKVVWLKDASLAATLPWLSATWCPVWWTHRHADSCSLRSSSAEKSRT